MACSKLSKITKQHEKTWSILHKRLMEMEFNFQELFNDNVWEFLQKKAASLSTSVGYLFPCILTSTAFVASTGSLISHEQHEIPFNLYFIFVGPPFTGKSQALKEGANLPMSTLIESEDIPNFLLDKAKSSGLAKTVADNGKGFVVSPEVFDLLNKLLKSDDENATRDSQLLCVLFSGESVSYRYASKKNTRNWLQSSLFNRRRDTGSVCCSSNRQDGPRTWFTRLILVHLPHLSPAFPPGHRGSSVMAGKPTA